MHGDEQKWVQDAIRTNWVSTVGANINAAEELIAAYVGCKYAVGLSCGTAALHLATKLAGEKLYGQAKPNAGTLQGRKVFCSDTTFDASINPVAYEDGEAHYPIVSPGMHCIPCPDRIGVDYYFQHVIILYCVCSENDNR